MRQKTSAQVNTHASDVPRECQGSLHARADQRGESTSGALHACWRPRCDHHLAAQLWSYCRPRFGPDGVLHRDHRSRAQPANVSRRPSGSYGVHQSDARTGGRGVTRRRHRLNQFGWLREAKHGYHGRTPSPFMGLEYSRHRESIYRTHRSGKAWGCSDRYADCAIYAARGDCAESAVGAKMHEGEAVETHDFMQSYCPKSCGLCAPAYEGAGLSVEVPCKNTALPCTNGTSWEDKEQGWKQD